MRALFPYLVRRRRILSDAAQAQKQTEVTEI
jgi:hypothetical protein